MIVFENEKDKEQFEDLIENSLTRFWKKASKDIDCYLDARTIEIEKNTQSIRVLRYVIVGLALLIALSFLG
jgi:hypothetical protein